MPQGKGTYTKPGRPANKPKLRRKPTKPKVKKPSY